MKRVLAAMLCLFCIAGLAGCSKKTVTSLRLCVEPDAVNNGGYVLSCNEHRGYEALEALEEEYEIKYMLCNTMDYCPHNTLGVLIDDMTDYKGGKYYTGYLDTLIVYYLPYKDQFIECQCSLKQLEQYSVNQILEKMYNEASHLALSTEAKTVDFQNILTVNVSGYDFKARPGEVVIPGLLKVSSDDGSVTATSSVVVGSSICGYYGTAAYEYYQYNGALIQVTVGTDIESLVTFK